MRVTVLGASHGGNKEATKRQSVQEEAVMSLRKCSEDRGSAVAAESSEKLQRNVKKATYMAVAHN